MATKVRVNKLLRKLNISLDSLQEVMNDNTISPTSKIGLLNRDNTFQDAEVEEMSIEELIEYKNDIHRLIDIKLESLRNQLDNPQLYTLSS